MAKTPKLFGYWISSIDETSAKEAVKMAGLPILIMGANAALLTLISLVKPGSDLTTTTISAAVALSLIILAFRIRAGNAAWMPIACILFIVFTATSAVSSYFIWKITGANHITGTQVVMSWVVPAICVVFTLAGFKGWILSLIHI